jgi:L-fuconolactonase
VRVAVEAFGSERLVCGSDWPVALLNGDYARVWRETTAAIDQVAGPLVAAEIMTRTAEKLYRLER